MGLREANYNLSFKVQYLSIKLNRRLSLHERWVDRSCIISGLASRQVAWGRKLAISAWAFNVNVPKTCGCCNLHP